MIAAEQVERICREEHGRVLAALISQFEDFDLAEDALRDALVNSRVILHITVSFFSSM